MPAGAVPFSPWPLTIDFRIPDDGTPTLVCCGRITHETCDFFKAEVKRLVPRNKLIIVDFSRVKFIDSSGLGTVLATYLSAKAAGCTLKLVNFSDRVKDLLRITRLAAIFGSPE